MKITKTILSGCALILGLSLSACEGAPVQANAAQDDTAAPAVADTAAAPAAAPADGVHTTTADDKTIANLIKAAEGKVVVLNFWATWCPPCVAEMPHFIKFYDTMDRDTTAFISLSADDPETYETVVAAYRKEAGVNFPIHVLDTRAPDALYDALRTEVSGALPTTIIYNKMGKVVHLWERDTTYEELSGAVKALL